MNTVVVLPYSPDWPEQFETLHALLRDVFTETDIVIEHIGSTAVPGLAAKPVIDIALGAPTLERIEAKIDALAEDGFDYVRKYERELPMRRYFVRPPMDSLLRVHLHGLVSGDDHWQRHLAFRDALRNDPTMRERYQSLKLLLAERHADDKSAYTEAKAPFILEVLGRRVG